MNRFHPIALALVLPLAACGRNDPPPPPAPPPAPAADPGASPPVVGMVGRRIQDALDAASAKLATANIPVGARIHEGVRVDDSGTALPKAEITPQGDLLIEGKAVSVTPAQRKELLTYRARIIGIAEAGMAIGGKGADLAGEALGGVVGAIFGGKDGEKEFEKKIEAEAAKIEAEAMKLCTRLPALMAGQQALAASLPEFKPYARMTQADVDDCGKDVGKDKGVAVTSG